VWPGRRPRWNPTVHRRSRASASVAFQAQDQTKRGRQRSTAAPLRDLWARASDLAWPRRAVDEGVRVLSKTRSQVSPHVRFDERGVDNGALVAPLKHRQTQGAATNMPGLPPPRHIPTLPNTPGSPPGRRGPERGQQEPLPAQRLSARFGSMADFGRVRADSGLQHGERQKAKRRPI
jgi:hypothetical protein